MGRRKINVHVEPRLSGLLVVSTDPPTPRLDGLLIPYERVVLRIGERLREPGLLRRRGDGLVHTRSRFRFRIADHYRRTLAFAASMRSTQQWLETGGTVYRRYRVTPFTVPEAFDDSPRSRLIARWLELNNSRQLAQVEIAKDHLMAVLENGEVYVITHDDIESVTPSGEIRVRDQKPLTISPPKLKPDLYDHQLAQAESVFVSGLSEDQLTAEQRTSPILLVAVLAIVAGSLAWAVQQVVAGPWMPGLWLGAVMLILGPVILACVIGFAGDVLCSWHLGRKLDRSIDARRRERAERHNLSDPSLGS